MDALRQLARVVAGGIGLGRTPVAPGTAASVVAVLVGGALMRHPPALKLASLAATLGGVWAIGATGAARDDPGWIVIDEVAGQWITLLGLAHPTKLGLLGAFAVFRVLDIAKPGPIGWADRRRGALGVMGDDVIAGVLGAGILWAARRSFAYT